MSRQQCVRFAQFSSTGATFNEIVLRHEALRTTFVMLEGRPVRIAPNLTVSLPVIDLRELPEAEREAESRRLTTEDAQRLSICPLDRCCE